MKHIGIRSRKIETKQLGIGDVAPDFGLADVDRGTVRRLSSLRGRRVIISFFQFVACPVCKYNFDRMKQLTNMLGLSGITTICIFQSTPENLNKYMKDKSNLILLSDAKGEIYDTYVAKKASGILAFSSGVTMARNTRRYKQYIDIPSIKAMMNDTGINKFKAAQLPAVFMIDENGIIVDLFIANKVTDSMMFERLEAFIPENKRCKCNKKDCISPRCRETYDENMRLSKMIYMG